MLQDVEQVTAPDMEHDVLEPDAALFPELRVFASSQAKYFTIYRHRVARRVLRRHTLASSEVYQEWPKRGPTTILRQPTPTKCLIKNGLEIDDFKPVL
jgi:hypothetical protein